MSESITGKMLRQGSRDIASSIRIPVNLCRAFGLQHGQEWYLESATRDNKKVRLVLVIDAPINENLGPIPGRS